MSLFFLGNTTDNTLVIKVAPLADSTEDEIAGSLVFHQDEVIRQELTKDKQPEIVEAPSGILCGNTSSKSVSKQESAPKEQTQESHTRKQFLSEDVRIPLQKRTCNVLALLLFSSVSQSRNIC